MSPGASKNETLQLKHVNDARRFLDDRVAGCGDGLSTVPSPLRSIDAERRGWPAREVDNDPHHAAGVEGMPANRK